jgi:hypothetical protein
MLKLASVRLYALVLAAGLFLTASPAWAQYRPQPVSNPATGESYHIELSAALWSPSADINVSSESLGIPGTNINFKDDLGLSDQRFAQLKLVLRATKRNKFRVEFIPIKYEQSATLTKDIIFNGQRYRIGLPVNSTLDWKAWRFAYEIDVISRDRGFLGIVLDAKYTDVQATLASSVANEFAHAKAPIPAIGGIGRFYVMPNISVTAELTGLKVPDIGTQTVGGQTEPKYRAHYADFDLYGTVNFTNNIGAQLGFRSFDVGYLVTTDTGSLTMKGVYFGVVARY